MLAPFATLAFLVTLGLVATVIAEMLSQSGGKIAAALKGRSALAVENVRPVAVRISLRARAQRPLYARPQLRAAA